MTEKQQYIDIQGAREHNLKNINVKLPRDKMIVITGFSGAGKSSLAFNIIYAEGQRLFVESISAYARQYLELMQKPDVDSIKGLSPAISIEQKTTLRNPRSTVGTVTEIYDYLRLLFARVGVPYSPTTGLPISAQTISQIVDKICQYPEGSKLMLIAPLVRGRKGEYKKLLQDLSHRGFQRIIINGTVYDIDDASALSKNSKNTIEVVIDRIIIKSDITRRVTESVEVGVELGEGILIIEDIETKERKTFSTKFSCPVSGFTLEEVEPRLFSFNNPFGACPVCSGLGVINEFREELIVPNPYLSLDRGAIVPWSGSGQAKKYYLQLLKGVVSHYNCTIYTPFKQLPEKVQKVLLHGSGEEVINIQIEDEDRNYTTKKPFEGVMTYLQRRMANANDNTSKREEYKRYMHQRACEACNGYRLKPEALCVKIDNRHIGEVTNLSIEHAYEWVSNITQTLSPQNIIIAERIIKEVKSRLNFLLNVGLGYLSLARTSATLSGGESQRIRLASQIGSGLIGVIYVLDEPSIGLHQRDNDKLLETLKYLRDLGNTVIVVEHDEDAILSADYVIDMGPAAGRNGGEIIAQGPPSAIIDHPDSITGKYLSRRLKIEVPAKRRSIKKQKYLQITDVTFNNLKSVNCSIPLEKFICVTGVSGSGKSSLIINTLYPAITACLNDEVNLEQHYENIQGIEHIDKIIDIDQSPIGRTPRSNPATYTGIFTFVRDWFAQLPESIARGYGPGRFSFNVKGGRCEACEGDGVIKVEMHFLPDVYVTCDHCQGRRYNRETLEIKYKNKSIADILDLTIDEGIEFFDFFNSVKERLILLQEVGLGYIQIGQRATTLSGGEAQRIKLAKELSRRDTGKTLYILDEPTTGLHFADVAKLLEVLHRLVDKGNTVIVIEHNLDVIKTADWIIDLGPEGGEKGGEIIATGTPEEVAKNPKSITGYYLRRYLASAD